MLTFGFLALEQRRAKTRPPPGKEPVLPPNMITLPAIRLALQCLLAPIAKADRPYRRLILCNQLEDEH